MVIRLTTYVRIPRDAHRRKITRRAVFARDAVDVPVLRPGARQPDRGPRDPALEGRRLGLGEHRRLLRALQPAQGRPPPAPGQHGARAPSPGHRAARCSSTWPRRSSPRRGSGTCPRRPDHARRWTSRSRKRAGHPGRPAHAAPLDRRGRRVGGGRHRRRADRAARRLRPGRRAAGQRDRQADRGQPAASGRAAGAPRAAAGRRAHHGPGPAAAHPGRPGPARGLGRVLRRHARWSGVWTPWRASLRDARPTTAPAARPTSCPACATCSPSLGRERRRAPRMGRPSHV